MVVEVDGAGVVTHGHFEGRVALDGCFWLMTDLSLDTPDTTTGTKRGDYEIRQGPRSRGDTCVQVFLEKESSYDTLWQRVFRPDEDVTEAAS